MVSAGLDTVPANLIQCLAYLSTPHGQLIQEEAHRALLEVYGSPKEAWDAVLKEERVTFISAVVKETLRYYTVIAMSLPRASIKPIRYGSATIPAGTLFYMNARSADFDSSRFHDPYTFNPDRYIQDKSVSSFNVLTDCRLERIRALPSLTMHTARGLVCALARILQIGNCTWHYLV